MSLKRKLKKRLDRWVKEVKYDSQHQNEVPSVEKVLPVQKSSRSALFDFSSNKLPPTLMKLPAELRNNVWEFAILEDDPILVTRGFRLPPLVSVSRQNRHETHAMFALQSNFEATVHGCDARILKALRLADWKYGDTDLTVKLIGECNWGRLMEWCKELCENRNIAMQVPESDSSNAMRNYDRVIIAATCMANEARNAGQPWKHCERGLKAWRLGAGEVDADWLNN